MCSTNLLFGMKELMKERDLSRQAVVVVVDKKLLYNRYYNGFYSYNYENRIYHKISSD